MATQKAFDGSVLVVEKDPTYSQSSTSLSVGGIRQQFSTPENIEISKFSASFFKSIHEYLTVDDTDPDISFHEAGYLFLVSPKGLEILKQNIQLQKAHGVDVVLLSSDELKRRFEWLNVSDLAGGSLGLKNEGWIDPYSLLMAFKRKAQSLGVSFVKDEVIDVIQKNNRVKGIKLQDGRKMNCGFIVNAAGPRAAEIAAMAGIKGLPVHPRKRFVYTFECRHKLHGCPLVIDPSGVYFRPEGNKFLCGVSPPADQDPDCLDFKVNTQLFDVVIWPVLAHRVPVFEALERGFSWAGHYAVNIYDQNAILGPHPEVTNFFFANGFSGHGVQQSPAVGRAISELLTFGAYHTLDLSKFAYDRFASGALVRENNVV